MGAGKEEVSSSYKSNSEEEEEEEEEVENAESSTCSGPPPVPSTVAGLYRVEEALGSGSYSVVHRAVHKKTGEQVAVKFEWTKAEKGRRLLAEARLYERLGQCKDVPMVHWAGRQAAYNIMVMDMQGPSLDDRFSHCGRKFSLKTVLMLAEQMIDRIEFVHSRGILHRDIKPHNFLMGRGDAKDRVFIMDFGLAKRYRDPNTGKHIPCTERRGVTGTVRYASLNVHAGIEPSRRDDLEAIGYVLMHFLRGALPWQGLKGGSKRTKHERIRRVKQKTSIEELCKDCPQEFAQYFKHCRGLQFTDRPDYEHLRRLMRDLFARERFRRDFIYDWTQVDDPSTETTSATTAPSERRRTTTHRRTSSRPKTAGERERRDRERPTPPAADAVMRSRSAERKAATDKDNVPKKPRRRHENSPEEKVRRSHSKQAKEKEKEKDKTKEKDKEVKSRKDKEKHKSSRKTDLQKD